MRHLFTIAGLCAVVLFSIVAAPADAGVLVRVNKASQTMAVIVDGSHRYTWRVSTGLYGGGTPSGTFRPQWLSRNHRSSIYDDAPMPYSIFYDGNFAIHGTTQVKRLGRPASRGCIRLHPSNAAILFSLVQKRGKASTIIVVH
jgi:lipoprotein-anchoring transpeptidase ErfK/SrfK